MHYHLSSSSCYTLMAPLPSRRMKAVNNFTVSGYLVCVRDNSWDRALKRTKICFCFLSISLHCLWCSTLWPRSSLCTSSLFPFFSFLSPVLLLLYSLPPLSLLAPSPPPLSLHAVVCRHAGISGPQNDRPNLSALAPVTKDGCLAMCLPAIGACLSYSPCDWL